MEMALHELPLAFFTAIAPIGAGAFVALCVAFFKGAFTDAQLKAIDKYTIVPLLVAFVGVLCSVAHLTNADNAFNVLNTLGKSPLANEMAAFGVFVALACLYWIIGVAGGLIAFAVIKLAKMKVEGKLLPLLCVSSDSGVSEKSG